MSENNANDSALAVYSGMIILKLHVLRDNQFHRNALFLGEFIPIGLTILNNWSTKEISHLFMHDIISSEQHPDALGYAGIKQPHAHT